jgi:hypothetical protein
MADPVEYLTRQKEPLGLDDTSYINLIVLVAPMLSSRDQYANAPVMGFIEGICRGLSKIDTPETRNSILHVLDAATQEEVSPVFNRFWKNKAVYLGIIGYLKDLPEDQRTKDAVLNYIANKKYLGEFSVKWMK